MAQYIDKATLVAEIEKNKNKIEPERDWHFDEYTNGYLDALKEVLSLINTFEVKEVDLNLEITLWANAIPEIRLDDVERLATYFFELGLKAQKGE